VDEALKEKRAASVSRAFARSVRDNTLAEFAAQAVRFGGMVVLARTLTPSDFGALKALVAITAIASMFMQGGIPDALIQRKQLSREHECTAWWLSLGIATVAVAVVFAGAPLIASWMEMPELKGGVRLMCVPILVNGTSTVGSARLQREFRFNALALADVLAEVAFLGTALALLLSNLPEWSLIAGLAARFAAHGLTIWVCAGIPIGMPRISAARDLARFALSVWGGRIIQAASETSDYLLVGRLLGSGPLGFYGMARDLLRFVPDRLHKVAGRVAYAAFCKLQDDDKELARAYANFFGSIARIVLPIMACMTATAPDLVDTIYGHQWLSAAVPLQLLTGGIMFAGLNVAVSSVYFAKGYPALDIHLNGLRLVLIVLAIAASYHTGLLGVTAAISTVEAISALAAQYVGCRFTGLKAHDLLLVSMPGIWLAIICGLVAFLGESVSHFCGIRGLLALLISGLPAGIVYLYYEASNLVQMAKESFRGGRHRSQTAEPNSEELQA
jgi:O-antigen/teichoic acid export membrane protein